MLRDIAVYRAVWHSSAADYDHTGHLVTVPTPLPWISGGSKQEWLLFDLGGVFDIRSVSVEWGEAAARSILAEVSSDRENWIRAGECLGVPLQTTEMLCPVQGRYVRLLMHAGGSVVIYRVRIMAENGAGKTVPFPAAVHKDCSPVQSDGRQMLSGTDWTLIRASEVSEDGYQLSLPSECFAAENDPPSWLPATVPGTVLNSFLLAGAIPDPFFDDDQFQVSEEYFTADFWYRKAFRASEAGREKKVFLEFDKINWKADVYLNGTYLKNSIPGRTHSIEGAFIRARFDVTGILSFESENVLAVQIRKNDHPGQVTTQGLAYGPAANGGLLGADNPTLHASIGWDWLPTIRGRNTGILGNVSLHFCEELQILDPWMETDLDLVSESRLRPAENLMQKEIVRINGKAGPLAEEWHGQKGSSITVDLGASVPIGCVTLLWGFAAEGHSTDYESRYAERFSLEVSDDGRIYRNLDAFPGGEVRTGSGLKEDAPPSAGTPVWTGHPFIDSLPGATAHLDQEHHEPFSRFTVQPQEVRYLRFTVFKQRELNGHPVDTIVKEIQVYSVSPEEVEQSVKHSYVLDTDRAELTLHADIRNDTGKPARIQVFGRILPDGPVFSAGRTVSDEPLSEITVPLSLDQPRLWWPNTYGDQPLYTCELSIAQNGRTIDRKSFDFGVRRLDCPVDNGLLTLYCNGTRIVAKGGNWGMDDGLKRDTADTYFDKVRLHAEANMTMIRNWVGMTDHPAFYEACDRYGILIWDDFWLANPWDGPDPDDPEMFLENAADKIRRVRSHPSLAFYCGRNEGYPPEKLDRGLAKLIKELDGTRTYFPHSSAPPVSSGGGYSLAKAGPEHGIKQYFNDVTSFVMRSERGIPNVPELESARRFLRPEHLWPMSESWALHDWTFHANGPANTYVETLQNYLGGDFAVPVDHLKDWTPDVNDPVYLAYKKEIAKMCAEAAEAWTAEDFFQAAQMINYDHHRGMFEAVSARFSNGLLMWMSQSSWPSFMWQSYDYYLYTNGGYFGLKTGNQPTRAFLDPRNDTVLLSNATPRCFRDLLVREELFDLYGRPVQRKEYAVPALTEDAYAVPVATVDWSVSDTDVVFLRLTLLARGAEVLGQNTYWHNRRDYQDYRALRTIPKTRVSVRILDSSFVRSCRDGRDLVRVKLEVENGEYPSLNTRIRLLKEDGTDVLPVFFSENYLLLMPREKRTVFAEYDPKRLPGNGAFTVTAWN